MQTRTLCSPCPESRPLRSPYCTDPRTTSLHICPFKFVLMATASCIVPVRRWNIGTIQFLFCCLLKPFVLSVVPQFLPLHTLTESARSSYRLRLPPLVNTNSPTFIIHPHRVHTCFNTLVSLGTLDRRGYHNLQASTNTTLVNEQ
jgi:hypothetical protein